MLQTESLRLSEHHLANLYHFMTRNGDEANAKKIVDLYEKKLRDYFFVHFTGHFSAGKSSLINYLVGEEILPKSPIPTSANIVKLTSGQGIARIFFNEAKPLQYEEPYDLDMIKQLCMEKDTIRTIEIHMSKPIFPANTFLVDTPGIDAADDADRYMTESALHEVDVLYFVMDYNHVQAEENLQFLAEVQKNNVPIYIIINQIDKHDENELPFAEFKAIVNETFALWNILPKKVYYTSLKDFTHPENTLSALKADLFSLLHNHPSTDQRIAQAVTDIMHAHEQFIQDKFLAMLQEDETAAFDYAYFESIKSEISTLQNKAEEFAAHFTAEVEQTLKNAYVMPASLREVARQYLEAMQKDFKVGFFQAKKKTALEREKRTEALLTEINEAIQTTIEWKLKEKFSALLAQYEITDDTLQSKIQQFSLTYQKEDLAHFVKEGALVNGNYLLNYTNEVSNDIKTKYRRKANELLEWMQTTIQDMTKEKLMSLQAEYEELTEQLKQHKAHQEIVTKMEDLTTELGEQITTDVAPVEHIVAIEKALNKREQFREETLPINVDVAKTGQVTHYERKSEQETIAEVYTKEAVLAAIEQIQSEISDLANFSVTLQELLEKKERIENRELTIALFGAFSAGKSSFANALLGAMVLPVSPNPTTAVITRIRQSDRAYPHGSVVITYKSAAEIAEDVDAMTKDLTTEKRDLHQQIAWIKAEKIAEHEMLSNLYQAYLRALVAGYDKRKSWLGKTETIELSQLEAYVTDETIAAYIAAVDLYYDCPVTKKGITLVDTPGADSINARHTNVAFNYIKDADAIIYVTYYNHAITSADRDFLLQLGRVKDSFSLDKMFFIINAADLASDAAELQLVVDYVHEQLIQFGIRNARIYSLSSKNSLTDKLTGKQLNEQMAIFENDFYRFVEYDLQRITYQAAIWDIKRVQTQLENVLRTATLDQAAKSSYIEQLKANVAQAKKLLMEKEVSNIVAQNKERIIRQLHYVNERMYIRFHDMFTEYFNPTTITENGKRAQKQLEKNRNQLLDYVGYELLQEIRAVSLRMESFATKLLQQFYHDLATEIAEIDELFHFASFPDQTWKTPDYQQALQDVDKQRFLPALKLFKNKKQFFEQNEREKMKEKFYELLKPEMEAYVLTQQKVMQQAYEAQLVTHLQTIKTEMAAQIDRLVQEQMQALENALDVQQLEDKRKHIEAILATLDT